LEFNSIKDTVSTILAVGLNILVITYTLNGLLMIALPAALAFILVGLWKPGWRIWGVGFATFILSQAGHIPFNWGAGLLLNQSGLVYWPPLAQQVFNSTFLGLSAGLFEEGARYLVLRFWIKEARSWRNAVLFGAGHGGAEAIIFGVLALVSSISMLVMRGMDLSALVPAAQMDLAQQQIAAYWSAPWYDSLLGALERLLTLPVQVAMAVLVMQSFTRKNIRWLFLAILYHTVIDGALVFLMPSIGAYWTEALLCGFSVLSIVIIRLLRQPEPATDLPEVRDNPVVSSIKPIEETRENLDNTRFQN
jgi:uncharacterized membrane protein YhfC